MALSSSNSHEEIDNIGPFVELYFPELMLAKRDDSVAALDISKSIAVRNPNIKLKVYHSGRGVNLAKKLSS